MRTIIEHPCGAASYSAVMALLTARGYTPIKSTGAHTLECEPFRVETETDMLLTRDLIQQVQDLAGVFRMVTLPWAQSPVSIVELTGDALTARASTYFELVAHSPRLQALVDIAYPGRRLEQIARSKLNAAVCIAGTDYQEALHTALRHYCRETTGEKRSTDVIQDYLDDALLSYMYTSGTQLDDTLQDTIIPALQKLCSNAQ